MRAMLAGVSGQHQARLLAPPTILEAMDGNDQLQVLLTQRVRRQVRRYDAPQALAASVVFNDRARGRRRAWRMLAERSGGGAAIDGRRRSDCTCWTGGLRLGVLMSPSLT